MSTSSDPIAKAPDEASQAVSRERVRNRRVIIVTGILTVLVMGAVIALGLEGGDQDGERRGAGGRGDYGLPELYGRGAGRNPAAEDDGCPFDPEKPPRVAFDLPSTGLDFGAVKQGVVLKREIVFRNEGTGPLCVRRVEASCGCIKANLVGEKRRFEPGEEGRVEVVLDTKGREGTQKKTITLYTNAVDVPLQKFVARAAVSLGMRISPSFVNFGRVTAGHEAEVRIRLRTPKSDADWEVTDVVGTRETNGERVKYGWRVEEIPDAKDLVRELVITHPGSTEEDTSFQDTLRIRTTHPDREEFEIRAHLLVVKPILAVPRRAVLGFVPSKLPPPRIRLIAGDPSITFSLKSMHFEMPDGSAPGSNGSGFVATQGKDANGEPWVEVAYDGRERRSGPIRAVLVVETDLERMPELRIECYATVQ